MTSILDVSTNNYGISSEDSDVLASQIWIPPELQPELQSAKWLSGPFPAFSADQVDELALGSYSSDAEEWRLSLDDAWHPWPSKTGISPEWAIPGFDSDTSTVSDVSTSHENSKQCRECHQCFENRNALEEHAREFKHRSFVCEVPSCGKSYYRRDLYTRHKRTHQMELFYCDKCPVGGRRKAFKRRDHLVQHDRNCHSGAGKPSELRSKLGETGLQSSGCCCGCARHNGISSCGPPAESYQATHFTSNLHDPMDLDSSSDTSDGSSADESLAEDRIREALKLVGKHRILEMLHE